MFFAKSLLETHQPAEDFFLLPPILIPQTFHLYSRQRIPPITLHLPQDFAEDGGWAGTVGATVVSLRDAQFQPFNPTNS